MREFYFNGDFDWTLRGTSSILETGDPTFAHEMANHFLFAADPGDSVILHGPLPDDFREYLTGLGLPPPVTTVHPAFTSEARFTPFGWNAYAETLNSRYREPTPHAPLDAVRQANSRAFSRAFELTLGPAGLVEGGLFDSLAALEAHLAAHPRPAGWVAKANHGHAGTGNQRISGATPTPEERHDLEILFRENGLLALEPWQERVQDMAINFEVDGEGRMGEMRGHEMVNSRDGYFLGIKVSPGMQPPDRWRKELEQAARSLAAALRGIGYAGPVGMDAYAWSGPAGITLRPCVDVNARLSMALPAHGLSRRLQDRILLWIWAKPKKLLLPSTYADLKSRLTDAAFDPATRAGILAASPLHLDKRKPKRISFVICARDEEELVRLRERYHASLGRW